MKRPNSEVKVKRTTKKAKIRLNATELLKELSRHIEKNLKDLKDRTMSKIFSGRNFCLEDIKSAIYDDQNATEMMLDFLKITKDPYIKRLIFMGIASPEGYHSGQMSNLDPRLGSLFVRDRKARSKILAELDNEQLKSLLAKHFLDFPFTREEWELIARISERHLNIPSKDRMKPWLLFNNNTFTLKDFKETLFNFVNSGPVLIDCLKKLQNADGKLIFLHMFLHPEGNTDSNSLDYRAKLICEDPAIKKQILDIFSDYAARRYHESILRHLSCTNIKNKPAEPYSFARYFDEPEPLIGDFGRYMETLGATNITALHPAVSRTVDIVQKISEKSIQPYSDRQMFFAEVKKQVQDKNKKEPELCWFAEELPSPAEENIRAEINDEVWLNTYQVD